MRSILIRICSPRTRSAEINCRLCPARLASAKLITLMHPTLREPEPNADDAIEPAQTDKSLIHRSLENNLQTGRTRSTAQNGKWFSGIRLRKQSCEIKLAGVSRGARAASRVPRESMPAGMLDGSATGAIRIVPIEKRNDDRRVSYSRAAHEAVEQACPPDHDRGDGPVVRRQGGRAGCELPERDAACTFAGRRGLSRHDRDDRVDGPIQPLYRWTGGERSPGGATADPSPAGPGWPNSASHSA
jgi:hypothetical protein